MGLHLALFANFHNAGIGFPVDIILGNGMYIFEVFVIIHLVCGESTFRSICEASSTRDL